MLQRTQPCGGIDCSSNPLSCHTLGCDSLWNAVNQDTNPRSATERGLFAVQYHIKSECASLLSCTFVGDSRAAWQVASKVPHL